MENLSDLDALSLAFGVPFFLAVAGFHIAQSKGNAKWEARFQKAGVAMISLVVGAIALLVIFAQ